MTKIKFYKKKEFLIGFEVSGHTGYAEQGSDIVCSAISGMTQMTTLGLEKILNLKLNIKKNEKIGYLLCKLPKTASEEEVKKAQDWLNTLKISLDDVAKDYKKYIKMEVEDEIY